MLDSPAPAFLALTRTCKVPLPLHVASRSPIQQQLAGQPAAPVLAAAAASVLAAFRCCREKTGRARSRLHVKLQADADEFDALLREEITLQHEFGKIQCVALRLPETDSCPVPVVLVNCGCYGTLAASLERLEGKGYAAQGYAYVILRSVGAVEEIADGIFARWQADAAAVLDWLGEQRWCNGRVGCHGYSLIGNTAYATLAASRAPDAPSDRPVVHAIVPAISFSRISPTIFVQGQGLAAELALRFLWLAEVGLRPEREGGLSGLRYLWSMLAFFALPDWPGLEKALARPIDSADVRMWGRPNVLWRGGANHRLPSDSFWQDGRDAQCNFDAVFKDEAAASVHIVAGWHDMFLLQSLEDFVAAHRASGGCARLTVYTGGHFGVVSTHGKIIAEETRKWYSQHLKTDSKSAAQRACVRMQLIGSEDWLECDTWPPPEGAAMLLYLRGTSQSSSTMGSLDFTPSDQVRTMTPLSYRYDPADPTPYAGAGWLNLRKDGPQDQRPLETSRHEDLLLLTSSPMQEELDVVGEVSVVLFASCSAPECDLVARLCVVRSDAEEKPGSSFARAFARLFDSQDLGPGVSLNLCEGVSRVQFPGREEAADCCRVEISLGPTACRLHKGDKLRLHVCSAAHPRWLRHPLQSPEEDWLLGSGSVGSPARISIFADAERRSQLRLPLRGSSVRVAEIR
eukprot:TRINITY_DN40959_c0_g1_i1.p1 TRINITY_DN40959_c0_g1~~TRINITY_DN40959_c0_g1_i1.p1  ORF type:complete len:686 (+),score=120.76 TRINITY_DN40959_c0_g1_i1:23-2080(+)